MDIGIMRPVVTGPATPVPKATHAAPVAAEPAVEARKTIDPATDAANARDAEARRTGTQSQAPQNQTAPAETSGPDRAGPFALAVERVFEEDDRTGEYVFKKIDTVSGDVVEQVPQEVILRMRAALAASLDPSDATRQGQIDKTA